MSDYHHLIVSMIEAKLALEEPKILVHCNFKCFNNDYFEEELSSKLDLNNKVLAIFEDNFLDALNNMHLKNKTF